MSRQLNRDVVVEDLRLLRSVGNAREPWRFTLVSAAGAETCECVMMANAPAGQLETSVEVEFRLLRSIAAAGLPVPEPLWSDPAGDTFGRPFTISRYVPGTADVALLNLPRSDVQARAVLTDLARATARIHSPALAGKVDWLAEVSGPGSIVAELDRWRETFERQRLEPLPSLAYAFAWLYEHAPTQNVPVLVHGDLRVGNILYEPGRLTAVLDWEMAHLGDPAEDIAWAYRWLWRPDAVDLEEFVATYEDEAGVVVDRARLAYFSALGEVKHAVISLTGTRSFTDRRTSNLKMAERALTVPAFMREFFAGVEQIEAM